MKRITEFDFLRAFAIISVIIIHSSIRYAHTGVEYLIGGWFSTFTRPCIAIFLFISGFLLAGRVFNGSELIKRFKRVLWPYLIFSALALLYNFNFSIIQTLITSPWRLLFKIIIGDAFGVYYFVFIICCIYVLYFVLVRNNISMAYALIFFGIILFVHNAYFSKIINQFGWQNAKAIELYTYRYVFWPFFFLLGVLSYKLDLLSYIKAHKSFFLIIWLIVFIFYNVLYFAGVDNISGFDSIIGSLYSIATIFFLLTLNLKHLIINYLSQTSYYLYFSHIFVVYILRDAGRYLNIQIPFWFSLVSFVASLALPILFYEIQKILTKDRFSQYLGV